MAERKKGKGARRSRHEWQTLLTKFDHGDIGAEAFCRRQAISTASFYRWRSLLDKTANGAGGDGLCSTAAPAFVDLGVLDTAAKLRRQDHPVVRAIRKRVVGRVFGHQEIEGRLVVLLNDNFALDHELAGGGVEGGDRNRIVFRVTVPTQGRRRRDFQLGGFDVQLVALSRAQAQGVRFEPPWG